MPWDIRVEDGQFCVYNTETDETVQGGCHPDRPAAVAHMQALYVNVEEAAMHVDTGFFVDLFADDGSNVSRALSGEAITILPMGTFWRGGKEREINDAVVGQFVDNWEHRTERGIRRSRLAVDVDHDGRARGWYQDVMALSSGVGATFKWNKSGRAALESQEYAYFSPTVYWMQHDRVTNAVVKNQLGGGALTNYPFFGEATALYSLRELDPDAPPMWYAVTKTRDGVQYPARAFLVVEDPSKPSTWHLPVMSWKGGKLVYDHGLMGAAKAALTAPRGHRGRPYQGPQKAEALAKLKRLYKREGLEFTEGGSDMSVNTMPGIAIPEAVITWVRALFSDAGGSEEGDEDSGEGDGDTAGAPDPTTMSTSPVTSPTGAGQGGDDDVQVQIDALIAQVATFAPQIEQYRAQITDLQAQLATERLGRREEQFTVMARDDFAHMPAATDQMAQELLWLHSVDQTDGQTHVEFWMALLQRADQQFADAFRERGGAVNLAADTLQQINGLVAKYQEAHPGTDWSTALDAVIADNPELYAQYRAEQGGEGS
jgi:hypothetical protein